MTQISILGCGWLGLPLAKALLKNGFSVKGSTIVGFDTAASKEKAIRKPTEFIKTKTVNDWKKQKVDLHNRPCIFIIQKN